MFLSFSEYKLLGGKIRDEPSFNRAERKARMKINKLIDDRLKNEDPVREIVKQLVLELIETGYCGSLDGIELAGTSNDGRSWSIRSNEGKADALIREWLANEEADGRPLIINRGGISFSNVVRV